MSDPLPKALIPTYDSEADAYYFKADCQWPSVRQIGLGSREVILDVDAYGRIIGVEVL